MIQAPIIVGAARKSAQSPPASRYRPIPVAKHARNRGQHALILVRFNVILVRVRPAALWAQSNRASAARTRRENFAEKQTTKMAGAAKTFVAICCLVVSILAKSLVIVGFVANVQCK